MKDPTVEPEPCNPKIVIWCRECGTHIYPRKSPAGPMALICDCARDQIERALSAVPILEVRQAEN